MASLLNQGMQESRGDQALEPGAEGENVLALQKALTAAGYSVEETGVYDEATIKAVKAFQRDKGMPESGIADEATMQALKGGQQPQDDAELMYGGAPA